MSTLTTAAAVRGEGNLPATVLDDQLAASILTASIEVKKLITPDVYAEVIAEANTVDRKIELSKAEANLALSYAVYTLNIETQGSGIVRTKGWDQSRSELLSQGELEKLSQHFRDIALSLISPYLPAYTGDPDDTEDDDDVLDCGSYSMGAV